LWNSWNGFEIRVKDRLGGLLRLIVPVAISLRIRIESLTKDEAVGVRTMGMEGYLSKGILLLRSELCISKQEGAVLQAGETGLVTSLR
jgi:hypothetical protein